MNFSLLVCVLNEKLKVKINKLLNLLSADMKIDFYSAGNKEVNQHIQIMKDEIKHLQLEKNKFSLKKQENKLSINKFEPLQLFHSSEFRSFIRAINEIKENIKEHPSTLLFSSLF